MSIDFVALETAFSQGGSAAAFDTLIEQLRSDKKYHELFEALKMRTRHRLGLPLVPSESNGDDLPEATRLALEDGLIDACRQVGEGLLRAGKVREGWMYFRPVGDKPMVVKLLEAIEPDEDNTEELIEVWLHEGIDTARGFQLLIDQNGLCNAITTYDQVLAGRSKRDRRAGAAALLNRLYSDLFANVQADIVRQERTTPKEHTLAGMIADRDWLFHEGAYHIDTTHLASVVRMARVLEEPEQLRRALDLTEYGRRLSPQLQYQGDEPFVDQYPTHALFYTALLGEKISEAVPFFREKAELLDPQYHGTEAIEVYLDLLVRTGQPHAALQAAISLMPATVPYSAYAPLLLDLSQKVGDTAAVREFCRQREDPLGFIAALVK